MIFWVDWRSYFQNKPSQKRENQLKVKVYVNQRKFLPIYGFLTVVISFVFYHELLMSFSGCGGQCQPPTPAGSNNGINNIFLFVVPPTWPPWRQMQTINTPEYNNAFTSWYKSAYFNNNDKLLIKCMKNFNKILFHVIQVSEVPVNAKKNFLFFHKISGVLPLKLTI